MTRRRSKYEESCCSQRTSLELALIAILLLAVLFSIALIVFLTLPEPAPTTCVSPQCIIEASQIVEHIDYTTDPCEDFYQFSCGNFLKNSHGDENLGPFRWVEENVERQLLELYSEPLQDGEHRMVTAAKNLFRACMDEYAIEKDELQSIQKVLDAVGGWPAVEGPNWDDTQFNWVQATYKLRDRGYPFAAFLNLLVTPDPTDDNRYIFEVSIPTENFHAMDIDTKGFMADTAVLFGADTNDALMEMEKTREFVIKLQPIIDRLTYGERTPHISTVSDFQEHGYYVNWLDFINTLANPAAQISSEDFVIFPQPSILKEWFYLISKTSKRDQANYMVWKVIEAKMPYLSENIQKRKMRSTLMPSIVESEETRAKFCLRETEKRFSPNPINTMHTRKYLDNEKKKKVELMVNYIQQEYLDILREAFWVDDRDKQDIQEKIQGMEVVIGAPDDYLDDRIFDEFSADMQESQGEKFLDLLSNANKNYQTNLYKRVYKSRQEIILQEWYQGSVPDYKLYDREDNVMRIPMKLLQGVFFNDDRPNYLNYGGIGTGVGYEFVNPLTNEATYLDKDGKRTNGWSNKTREGYLGIIECMATNMNDLELDKKNLLSGTALREALALKTSYEAYKNWVNENGEELQLTATKYTPKQLFWVAAAFTTCQPKNLYNSIFSSLDESDYLAYALMGAIKYNSDFAQDFRCPEGSPMNPINKCQIF